MSEDLRKRPDASMLLLNEVMHRPVDPGYFEAAERRRLGAGPQRGFRTTARITVLAIFLGFATATAAMALRTPQSDVVAARTVLEQEIRDRRVTLDAAKAEIDALDHEIEQIQTQALSEQYPALISQLERDSAAAGTVAVRGPGLVITMRDGAKAAEEDSLDARVQDYDIQVVVNALFAAGAEAISINDQRLTATSAIRSAGDAILVDLVGLSGPYVIKAVGAPDTLSTYFTRSLGQQHLSLLGSRYGIAHTIEEASELRLGAGPSIRLFHARAPEDLELPQQKQQGARSRPQTPGAQTVGSNR